MSQDAPLYRPSKWMKEVSGLVMVESTRHGGISPAPYNSLNVGWSTADTDENTYENRHRLLASFGALHAMLASSHQIHGSEVLVATKPGRYDGYDAMITNVNGLLLSVSVADCTPVLVVDPNTPAVAAIHAGWKGTMAGIVGKTIRAMQEHFDTDPEDCLAFIGTCIDECSFEVDADVADHFDSVFKSWDEQRQKFFIDLKKANRQQLIDAGLPDAQIEVSPYSTVLHNTDYFSHRAEKGLTGRFMGLVGLLRFLY